MGTPPACCYATIYYGVREHTLLQKYKDNLIFYKRYIDDVFGIWIPTDSGLTFNDFKSDLKYHKLRWETNPPSTTVTFLDMILTIKHTKVETQLYEKCLIYTFTSAPSPHTLLVSCRAWLLATFYAYIIFVRILIRKKNSITNSS